MKISQLLQIKEATIKISEAKDYFPDVDVIKLDPDRADTYDIVQALMPTLVRTAYVHLSHDKDKYERTHTAEDDEPFEFSNDALEERLDTLIDAIRNRLDDQSSHDKHSAIEKIKSEFKEKLTEAVETPANLMPTAKGKKVNYQDSFQFKGSLSAITGKKKIPSKDGKQWTAKNGKIIACWDSLESKGWIISTKEQSGLKSNPY